MIFLNDPRPEYCGCEGKCFARGESGRCGILTEAYKHNDCPFQKPDRRYTNGVFYPDYPYELRVGTG